MHLIWEQIRKKENVERKMGRSAGSKKRPKKDRN
jgi:hypothetical protein